MRVIGKESLNDKARRNVAAMTLREQKEYYRTHSSWLLFYKSCYDLGEITREELIKFRKKVLGI